jgi:hypothetical protein
MSRLPLPPIRRPDWISERMWRWIYVAVALLLFAAILILILWPLTVLW